MQGTFPTRPMNLLQKRFDKATYRKINNIVTTAVRNEQIKNKYNDLMAQGYGSTKAIEALMEKFNLSESSIKSAVHRK